PLIVVTGYEPDLITASLAGLPVQFSHNADYATGMASSLRTGIAAVPPDCSAAVILLGDMPQIKADLINQLIAALSQHPQAKALVPTFVNAQGQEERGNPVVLTRSLFTEIGRLSGDQGARKLLSGEGVLDVPVADPAIALDIDTPEALARLQSSLTQTGG
ncbi:MAG: nucleotidyltransferase family protein, partial [Alphaproteobacteria bacterium]|nr:nucleotidyltransferase family protein [Alphaproteobacteria bacterium]